MLSELTHTVQLKKFGLKNASLSFFLSFFPKETHICWNLKSYIRFTRNILNDNKLFNNHNRVSITWKYCQSEFNFNCYFINTMLGSVTRIKSGVEGKRTSTSESVIRETDVHSSFHFQLMLKKLWLFMKSMKFSG